MRSTRRAFLRDSGLIAGAAVVGGSTLAILAAHTARATGAANDGDRSFDRFRSDYGALEPKSDQDGRYVLALPRDFDYVTFSAIGDLMSDGNVCPRAHDGMTCLEGRGSLVRLIRNHEVFTAPGAFSDPDTFSMGGHADTRYDPLGVGGTVTLDFDLRKIQARGRAFIAQHRSILAIYIKAASWRCSPSRDNPRPTWRWATRPARDCPLSGSRSTIRTRISSGAQPVAADKVLPKVAPRSTASKARSSDSMAGKDQLVLVFESPAGSVLDSPDNICITPRGGILLCEDDESEDGDGHPLAPGIADVNRLIGLGRLGEPFEFAVNLLNASELAGACFSPDGRVMFVNIYGDGSRGSGMTCAIWGPWERGPL